MERILGIGGVFFKARDPKALAAWYREHLGVPVEPEQIYGAFTSAAAGEQAFQSCLLRDLLGNPIRPMTLDPNWLTPSVANLAQAIYDKRAFDRLPILADTL